MADSRLMIRYSLLAVFVCLLPVAGSFGDEPLLDSMDAISFTGPAEKVRIEQVPGRAGGALRFTFTEEAKSAFATGKLRGQPEWDKAAGFSFWVKGDGSPHLGALQFVWGENYSLRYDFAFPISDTDWRKVVVPWRDLVPVLPGSTAKPIDASAGNAPSKLGQLWFGKWWYWRDVAAHGYAIDEVRLETSIVADVESYRPAGVPLQRVRAKLAAGQPVTIVTMGDSLTDLRHWANREVNWPALLKQGLQQSSRSEVTLVNPAIGGTQLGQNVVMIPHWIASTPAPDLVTICFGYNDWEAGMRGEMFLDAMRDAVQRVRRATGGRTDVLLVPTLPALERWDTMEELAEAVRRAGREENAAVADVSAAMHAVPEADRAALFASDKTHLGAEGHRLFAATVLRTLQDEPEREAVSSSSAPR
jgi:lysophospholipase L1-like esterase